MARRCSARAAIRRRGRDDDRQIAEHVADQQALLILLDNCEHVIPDAARVDAAPAGPLPGLRVLATSREALGVRGETVWPVPPMSIEDAVRLFVDRAGPQ